MYLTRATEQTYLDSANNSVPPFYPIGVSKPALQIFALFAFTQSTMSVEDLPVELRVMVFHYLSDTATLSALVHASPAHHAAYVANREKIFTHFTIKKLEIGHADILKPASFIEVNTPDNEARRLYVKSAIPAYHQAVQEHKEPRLTVEQCLALLAVRDVVRWCIRNLRHKPIYDSWLHPQHNFLLDNFRGTKRLLHNQRALQFEELCRADDYYPYGKENYFCVDLGLKESPRMRLLDSESESWLPVCIERDACFRKCCR